MSRPGKHLRRLGLLLLGALSLPFQSDAQATKVLFDTDPGVDDAMVVILAIRSPELEVLGLTTIFGNVETELATLDALRLVELSGEDTRG